MQRVKNISASKINLLKPEQLGHLSPAQVKTLPFNKWMHAPQNQSSSLDTSNLETLNKTQVRQLQSADLIQKLSTRKTTELHPMQLVQGTWKQLLVYTIYTIAKCVFATFAIIPIAILSLFCDRAVKWRNECIEDLGRPFQLTYAIFVMTFSKKEEPRAAIAAPAA